MSNLKIYKSINSPRLRAAWHDMEQESNNPFCYYEYMSYVWWFVKYTTLYSPRIACMEDDRGEVVAIAPLKWDMFKRCYRMLGDVQGCGATSLLYRKGMSQKEKADSTHRFFERLIHPFKFRRMEMCDEDFEKMVLTHYTRHTTDKCVSIDFSDGTDSLYQSLSKSVRQNIRTAYNRMKTNGIDYRLKVYDGKRIDDTMWNKIQNIYISRLFSKYKSRKFRNAFARWYNTYIYKHLKHDSRSLRSMSGTFHAILLNGDEPMAFFSGLKTCNGKKVSIPRLAINDKYAFYSPGYTLLFETMKYMEANTPCRLIDLTRGDEKYKTDMGGKIYYTYDISST